MSGASNDGRPPMVIAMWWVHQITTIAVEMALPAGLGHWADTHWGTEPWLVGVGALLGFAVAMLHLLRLTKQKARPSAVRRKTGEARDRGEK